MGDATCVTPKCARPPSSFGLCSACYQRNRKTGIQLELLPRVVPHTITNPDRERRRGDCLVCGPDVPIKIRTGRTSHVKPQCDRHHGPLRKRTPSTPEQARLARLKWKYGLTSDQYEAMVTAQAGRCAICDDETKLVVDHCHKTGRVRGLLCHPCNVGIGNLHDDPELFRRAAAYVA